MAGQVVADDSEPWRKVSPYALVRGSDSIAKCYQAGIPHYVLYRGTALVGVYASASEAKNASG